MARTPDPNSKAGFVRSQPASLSAVEVVAAGKAKGLKLDVAYVHAVRSAKKKRSKAARATAKKTNGGPTAHAATGDGNVGNGLVAQIERMASEMVNAALKAKLSKLLG